LRFTVRRPPTGEVSPCCHRPSGGDVACSVDVGVASSGSAGFAIEDRLALAVSKCDVPTHRATLRRVRSWDLFDPAETLVLQTRDEQAPAAPADRTIEPALLSDTRTRLLDGAARRTRHRPHIQLLDPNHVKPPCQVSGCLLDPVLSPIPLSGPQSRDRPLRLSAALGTALAAGQPLLQHLQPLRLTQSQTGCVQQFPSRQRRRHHNTAIDANHAAITWTADRVGDMRERDVPAAGPITSNAVGLDALGDRPRQAKPHPPHLGHPYPTEAAVQLLDVMRFQPDLPKPLVHTCFTPPWLPLCAIEKVLHRLREIAQRLLHRLTPGTKPRVLSTGLCQLRGLLLIAGSLAFRLPVHVLLYRNVPHIPRIPTMRQQRLLLLRSRQQSKPRHIRTLTTATDKPARSESAPCGNAYLG
jgi:hypothetical protein